MNSAMVAEPEADKNSALKSDAIRNYIKLMGMDIPCCKGNPTKVAFLEAVEKSVSKRLARTT